MEVQLQELIEQIKRNGVDAAEAEAASIIQAANEKAEAIISDAQAQAEQLLQNAKAENDRMVRASEDAIRQAGRNLMLSFRQSVARELDVIVGDAVSQVYSSQALSQLIVQAVAGWAAQPDTDDIRVILSEDALQQLEQTVLAALKEKMINGVTLQASGGVSGGFRISVRDGSYYDYSTEAVAAMLSSYLSPRMTQLLKEAQ